MINVINSNIFGMDRRYRDKEWLETKYIDEKLSTYKIGKLCGVTEDCIQQWLKRFKIVARPGFIINNSVESPAIDELITGTILGDGSLCWGSHGVSVYFSMTCKYELYLEYVRDNFESLGLMSRGRLKGYTNTFGKFYIWQTLYYRGYLVDLYKKWYNNHKKTLPEDIHITPTTLRIFYIEDGGLSVNLKTEYVNAVYLFLNDFCMDDIKRLRELIAIEIKTPVDDIRINENKKGQYGLTINKRFAIKAFFEYIGDCPQELLPIYGYKWPDRFEPQIIRIGDKNGKQ